jgi:hypothetical protein
VNDEAGRHEALKRATLLTAWSGILLSDNKFIVNTNIYAYDCIWTFGDDGSCCENKLKKCLSSAPVII